MKTDTKMDAESIIAKAADLALRYGPRAAAEMARRIADIPGTYRGRGWWLDVARSIEDAHELR